MENKEKISQKNKKFSIDLNIIKDRFKIDSNIL